MLERTYKYRIYPRKQEQKCFEETYDSVSALYNMMLQDRTKHYQKTGTWKPLDANPFIKGSLLLRDLEPSIIQWTVNALEKAYEHYFYIRNTKLDRYKAEALEKKAENPEYVLTDTDLMGYPKPKKMSSQESWTIGPDQVLLIGDRVQIPNMGQVKIRLHRPIPAKASLLSYTVLKKSSGEFYLLIQIQLPAPECAMPAQPKAIGLSLEPGYPACSSDGRPLPFRHLTQGQKNKIQLEYEKLKRKTPGSHRYERQRMHLASLYEKRANQRRDSLHKITAEILDKSDIIVIEEPAVTKKKNRLLRQGDYETVTDEAWWTFSEFIKYKTQEAGKIFWKVPMHSPVRNACSNCGVIIEKRTQSKIWECPYCGLRMPVPVNTARNLEAFGNYIAEQQVQQNRQD